MKGLVYMLFASLMIFVACNDSVMYHSYQATPVEGWEHSDVVVFDVDSLKEDVNVGIDIEVRTTVAYPFQTLWLLVEQDYTNPMEHSRDTLVCNITTSKGEIKGNGISIFQYSVPYKQVHLSKGQTGTISVHHIMRREILPGISDIGLKITKE